MTSAQRLRTMQLIVEFDRYASDCIPAILHNFRLIIDEQPKDESCAVLSFLVTQSINGALTTFILQVCEAIDLLNLLLNDLGENELNDQSLSEIVKVRNKVVAHGMRILSKTDQFMSWFDDSYSEYDRIVGLITEATSVVRSKIRDLEGRRKLVARDFMMKVPRQLDLTDVPRLEVSVTIKQGLQPRDIILPSLKFF